MDLRETLLGLMDRKDHWAWPHFSGPSATREQLRAHYRQEWAVYVRDFPVLLGRVYVRCPVASVRRELAENIYEEETGGLTFGHSHPELFLRMMEGLGLARSDFELVELLAPAADYRAWLDEVTERRSWVEGAAAMAIFVEGSRNDRAELEGRAPREVEGYVQRHPLVVHHGVPPAAMDLIRAHQQVEGAHRDAAWRMVLGHAQGREAQVVEVVKRALELWLAYRDGVASAAGVKRQTQLT
jgi:pyrroloquinoline-quinone synthase